MCVLKRVHDLILNKINDFIMFIILLSGLRISNDTANIPFLRAVTIICLVIH
jgi:hypothetical protein